ncbi:hypothetical protein [Microbacterium sp. Bi128]|uniref:hypothetical protein n=1 Tax=Microbacterium sp. Bi128 TaxID=2821115 RepID=UPI001D1B1586|nr:hypothetical protein [Microbacterium sp. Bi128]CAH0198164.1 hypothetical protein SRABI128_01673 [Microbacterium sp. Bi128]
MTALTAPLVTATTVEKLLLTLSRVLADHAHARMHARVARADATAQRAVLLAKTRRPVFEAESYLRVR